MIQPAAPSLLAATPARSFPQPAGGGVAFALSLDGVNDASSFAGSPMAAGEDRHDDAAPGNLLPSDAAPALAPWTGETLAPEVPLPVARPDMAAPAPVMPARSAKFTLPSSALPSPQRTRAPSAAGQDAALDPDQAPARAPEADVMSEPAVPTQPGPPPVASIAIPDPAKPLPPATPEPMRDAPLLASAAPAVASSRADPPPPRTRLSPNPITSTPNPSTSVALAGTASTPVSTSALTPVDSRMDAGTPGLIAPPMVAPVLADTAAPILTSSALPLPSDVQTPVGVKAPITPAPVTLVGTGGIAPTVVPSPAPVDVAAPSDRAITSPPSSEAAEQSTIVVPLSTAGPRPALPTVTDDAATRPPPSVTASAATTLPGVDRQSRPMAPASSLAARDRPLPWSSRDLPAPSTPTTFPAGWQWSPRAVAGQPAPTVAQSAIVAAEPTPIAVPASIPADRPALTPSSSTAMPADAKTSAPVPAERRAEAPLAVPLPIPTMIAPPVTSAPAAIVFGAARFAAQVAEDRDEPAAPLGVASIGAPQAIERAVANVAAPTQASLDMRQEHWPHAMIERIEMIRDAADAADTRIRLIPDALGAIDVEVKRDGDTLNVRFQAEQAQTRTLLADAAPRLAEAAEARGLRLGQSSVGADTGSAGQGQQRQALAHAPPRAPRSPVADAQAADDDTRLA